MEKFAYFVLKTSLITTSFTNFLRAKPVVTVTMVTRLIIFLLTVVLLLFIIFDYYFCNACVHRYSSLWCHFRGTLIHRRHSNAWCAWSRLDKVACALIRCTWTLLRTQRCASHLADWTHLHAPCLEFLSISSACFLLTACDSFVYVCFVSLPFCLLNKFSFTSCVVLRLPSTHTQPVTITQILLFY